MQPHSSLCFPDVQRPASRGTVRTDDTEVKLLPTVGAQ